MDGEWVCRVRMSSLVRRCLSFLRVCLGFCLLEVLSLCFLFFFFFFLEGLVFVLGLSLSWRIVLE